MDESVSAVKDGMVVTIHYTLKGDDGEVIDTSEGGPPLTYLHGAQNIVPGLERELTGKNAGQRLEVDVAPRDGYGEHDPRGMARVGRDAFPEDLELEPGMQFGAEDEQGGEHTVWIRAVEGDTVVIDRNHPLAGVTLRFAVSIESVRQATREELAHGHVHGAGGHLHH
jgi:FKBP-type peptidyl-prolyl cis-trans isomerase SlyD